MKIVAFYFKIVAFYFKIVAFYTKIVGKLVQLFFGGKI